MIADPAQRPPLRFALLAVLLVLPALGLAALALRALALDRRAADADATDRARDVAAAIAARLTNVIHAARPKAGPGTAWSFSSGTAWFELDAAGGLVWPRRDPWPPVPEPLAPAGPAGALASWRQAGEAWAAGDYGRAAAAYREAAEAARDQAGSGPPINHDAALRLRANALLRHAAALERDGEEAGARAAYLEAWQEAIQAGGPRTEAGVNVAVLAALRFLDLSSPDAPVLPEALRAVPENFLGGLADQPFTPLHDVVRARLAPRLPALAAEAGRPGLTGAGLMEAFERRDFARRAHAALQETRGGPGFAVHAAMLFYLDREVWLALQEVRPGGSVHVLHRMGDLFREARAAARAADPRGVFGIAVTAAGADFKVSQEEPAGVVERAAATVEARLPQGLVITVAAAQVDAAAFFATQRRRERTLGAVVLGAVAVSLAAAAATWAMLARQHRLGVEKSNLVAAVSHELRAPLASVRLLADNLAQGRVPDEARRADAMRLIGRECRRLGALVDNVLDLARIARGRRRYEFGPTDVAALVRETAASLAPAAAERGVGLRVEFAPGAETLEAMVDGRALQQALLNLLDNALKHAPAGSGVDVRLARGGDGSAPKSEIGNLKSAMNNGSGDGASQPRGGFTVTVTDAGPGIPAADRVRVFEPFHRVGGELRRETTGVGIGLAIVRHIVAAHGGRVWIEDAEPRGTRVVMELP